MTRQRCAFTLIEILVSLMIFSVVSLGMVMVLKSGVDLFRNADRARQASDQATAVLAGFEDDLRRMMSASAGGFLLSRRAQGTTSPDACGFAVKADDGSRQLVLWWRDRSDQLHRLSAPQKPDTSDEDTITEMYLGNWPTGTTSADSVVSAGCLLFAVSVLPNDGTWDWANAKPTVTDRRFVGVPTAISATVILAGGRQKVTGTFVSQTSEGIRVTGVRHVPLGADAYVRIGDPVAGDVEWIGYQAFAGGWLRTPQRGAFATDATANHQRGDPVAFGHVFTVQRQLR